MLTTRQFNKLLKQKMFCPICQKSFTEDEDPASIDWLKQYSGAIVYFHTKCFDDLCKK